MAIWNGIEMFRIEYGKMFSKIIFEKTNQPVGIISNSHLKEMCQSLGLAIILKEEKKDGTF